MKQVRKWAVSLIELKNGIGTRFKVTRRLPEMSVAETKMFRTKKKCEKAI